MYSVYIKINGSGCITDINSSAFITDNSGWTEIDRGEGDRYHHAQGNYLPKQLTNENGVCIFKFINGEIVERTAEEIAADTPAPEPNPPTNDELAAAIAELAEVICGG